jgi:hypothetical protein
VRFFPWIVSQPDTSALWKFAWCSIGAGAQLGHGEPFRQVRDKEAPTYRLYEVQNGNHIETFKVTFPQLELIQPHAQHAFDLLVSAVVILPGLALA